MATFAPNSAAIVMVDSAEKTVKLVAMDPTSAASTSTLSASGTDPDAAICQTRPKFGSQVARMKTASPTADARMTYRASVKTCLSAQPTMVRQFSLSARTTLEDRKSVV